jgi:hypothetical protein
MWLDFAEDQARRRKQIFLRTGKRSWINFCDLIIVRIYATQAG